MFIAYRVMTTRLLASLGSFSCAASAEICYALYSLMLLPRCFYLPSLTFVCQFTGSKHGKKFKLAVN